MPEVTYNGLRAKYGPSPIDEVLITWVLGIPVHLDNGVPSAQDEIPVDVLSTFAAKVPICGSSAAGSEYLLGDLYKSIGDALPPYTGVRSSDYTGEVCGDLKTRVVKIFHTDTRREILSAVHTGVDTSCLRTHQPVLVKSKCLRTIQSTTTARLMSTVGILDTTATGTGETIVRFAYPSTWQWRDNGQPTGGGEATYIIMGCNMDYYGAMFDSLAGSIINMPVTYLSIYAPVTEVTEPQEEEIQWAYIGQVLVTADMLDPNAGTITIDLNEIFKNVLAWYDSIKIAVDGLLGDIVWTVQASAVASVARIDTRRPKYTEGTSHIDTIRKLCNEQVSVDTFRNVLTHIGKLGAIQPKRYILDTQYTIDENGDDAWKMFDKDPLTAWRSKDGSTSINFYFSRSNLTILKEIQFGVASDISHLPSGVSIWGSENPEEQFRPSSNWVLIQSKTFTNNRTGLIQISNIKKYRSYRFLMFAPSASVYLELSSLYVGGLSFPSSIDTRRNIIPCVFHFKADTLRPIYATHRIDTFRKSITIIEDEPVDTSRLVVHRDILHIDTKRRRSIPFGFRPGE